MYSQNPTQQMVLGINLPRIGCGPPPPRGLTSINTCRCIKLNVKFCNVHVHCGLSIQYCYSQVVEDGRDEKAALLPRKKKCALLLSYCGAGYNGMQMYVK